MNRRRLLLLAVLLLSGTALAIASEWIPPALSILGVVALAGIMLFPLSRPVSSLGDSIVANASDAIVVVDQAGCIEFYNPAAEKLFGRSADELLGKRIDELVIEPVRETNRLHSIPLGGTVLGLAAGAREFLGTTKDGEPFPIEMALSDISSQDRSRSVAFIRNVRKRKQVQRYLAAHYAAIRILTEESDQASAMVRLLEAVCNHLGWETGAIWKKDAQTDQFRQLAAHADPATAGIAEFVAAASDTPIAFADAINGDADAAIGLGDLSAAAMGRRGMAHTAGLTSYCRISIKDSGELFGLVIFCSRRTIVADDQLTTFLLALGSQLGQYIERRKAAERILSLQDSLAQRVKELETALTEVKQLSGLLPMCCYCKRIRDDSNYWQQVENYIAAHSALSFSHGICPSCWQDNVQRELAKAGILKGTGAA